MRVELMQSLLFRAIPACRPDAWLRAGRAILDPRTLYSTNSAKSDKHSKFLKRLKNIEANQAQPKKPKANFHPVAVVGVLTLLYALYSAMPKKVKEDTYTNELENEIKQSITSLKNRNIQVIFVIGGPSSGKTTLCKRLADKLDAVHLSPSSLLEKELTLPFSPHSLTIANCLKNGVPIPTSIVTSILWIAINETEKTTFLIDGFPKKMDQAIRFHESICEPSAVLDIECPLTDMLTRFTASSGKSAEEATAIIGTRHDSIKESSFRVANYYSKLEKLVKVSCLDTEEVLAERVAALLKTKLAAPLNNGQ